MVTLNDLNHLHHDDFVGALAFAFEFSPWIPAETWEKRPFNSVDGLHRALCETVWHAPVARQLALIRAHPDLAGKAAVANELTPESTREQVSAGLNQLTPGEFASFTRLNAAYQNRFGFPFIICVREHTKNSILSQYTTRIDNTPEEERTTALNEITKIVKLRLQDAISE